MSYQGKSVLRNDIVKYFELKESYIGALAQYLGGKLWMAELDNGQKCWAFCSNQYVEAEVQNVLD